MRSRVGALGCERAASRLREAAADAGPMSFVNPPRFLLLARFLGFPSLRVPPLSPTAAWPSVCDTSHSMFPCKRCGRTSSACATIWPGSLQVLSQRARVRWSSLGLGYLGVPGSAGSLVGPARVCRPSTHRRPGPWRSNGLLSFDLIGRKVATTWRIAPALAARGLPSLPGSGASRPVWLAIGLRGLWLVCTRRGFSRPGLVSKVVALASSRLRLFGFPKLSPRTSVTMTNAPVTAVVMIADGTRTATG